MYVKLTDLRGCVTARHRLQRFSAYLDDLTDRQALHSIEGMPSTKKLHTAINKLIEDITLFESVLEDCVHENEGLPENRTS